MNPIPSPRENDRPVSQPGHQLMFVSLVSLSFLLFAPTILLPILREYGQLLAEEELLKQQNAQMEKEIDQENALALAFATDRTINERLAVLDLNFKNPNEEVLPVLLNTRATPTPLPHKMIDRDGLLIPKGWPLAFHRVDRWAARKGLIHLFLDPSLRPVFLLMAGGLIIAAFVLFAPHPPRRTAGCPAPSGSEPMK